MAQIDSSEKLRNLGVVLDKNLTMKNQINSEKWKAVGGLINVAKISSLIDKKSCLKLAHGLVISQIDFCNSILRTSFQRFALITYDLKFCCKNLYVTIYTFCLLESESNLKYTHK